MKQLFQDPRTGTIQVLDLPEPALRPGSLLVRNACSVISPGTERSTVSAVRSSYLRTARERPDLVRRVLDIVKRDGVLAAYRRVQTKLSEPQALGYASAGTVVAVGPGSGHHFKSGDRVACAGMGYASHAEAVCVPVNLAARIPDGVPFESAAFATLGAIALHGIRQAEPRLGEQWAVIGLGILGLLTLQLLRAHGIRVAAFDLSPEPVQRARQVGAEAGTAGSTDEQVTAALGWTEGLGVDGVIVTATSPNEAPMVAAAGMCRERGRVVAVGQVPFGLPREVAYAKELELRISRSYGPGRYDADFEEKGVDYPSGYVRWTETRNLEAFLQLLAEGRIDVASLVTHKTPIEKAPELYDELLSRGGTRPLGMLIVFPDSGHPEKRAERATGDVTPAAEVLRSAQDDRADSTPPVRPRGTRPVPGRIGVAFVGAGSFARTVLLPELEKRRRDVNLLRVVTAHGLSAHDVQRKFGFRLAGTSPDEAFSDPAVDLVFIATRHDLHADLAVQALRAGKHVFLEKPLALDEEQLGLVEDAATSAAGILLVGFNRRFSPMARTIREAVAGRGPLLMTCRVNAGPLPPGHWLSDPEVGGGRMVGEGCHFVDLLSFLAGDPGIASVQASSAGRPRALSEDLAVQIEFRDGSVGQILYTARGAPGLGKERVEVHAGGVSAVLDDFRTCVIHRGRKTERVSAGGKGHAEEIAALLAAVNGGLLSPIPLSVLVEVTRATFRVASPLAGSRS